MRAILLVICIAAVSLAAEPADAAAAAPEKPALENRVFLLKSGIRVRGTWDAATKVAVANGTDCSNQVLSSILDDGWTVPKTGVNPALKTKYDLAEKNYDRAQAKVTEQADYFSTNFMPLGPLWDILTPLDARLPATGEKSITGAKIESNMSVQARESFAVLQKHRKERFKWAQEIQAWTNKIREAK